MEIVGPLVVIALVGLMLVALVAWGVVSSRRRGQVRAAWQQYAVERGYRFELAPTPAVEMAIEGAIGGRSFRIVAHRGSTAGVSKETTQLKLPIGELPSDFFVKVMRKQWGAMAAECRVETDPQFDASFMIGTDDPAKTLAMCSPAFRSGFQALAQLRPSLTLSCVRGTYDPRVHYATEQVDPRAPSDLELYWRGIEKTPEVIDTALGVLLSVDAR